MRIAVLMWNKLLNSLRSDMVCDKNLGILMRIMRQEEEFHSSAVILKI